MTSMVELVARAIFSENTGTEFYETHHPAFEYEREYWETLARAAIGAMVEPTEAMVHSGLNCDAWAESDDGAIAMLRRTYIAMLNAALAESKEG